MVDGYDLSMPDAPSARAGLSVPTNGKLPVKELEHIVPFSELLNIAPPSEIRFDHLAAGLAAAFTTNIDNPFFKLPTKQDEKAGGIPASFAMYAPYYVGTSYTAEQIAMDVAEQGAAYLERLDAAHGFDGYVGRMMSVLRKGHVSTRGLQWIEDRNILFDVHDFMATITNRLRHLVPLMVVGAKLYSPAEEYREGTHRVVDPYVTTVACEETPRGFMESFVLPEYVRSKGDQLVALGWDFFKSKKLKRGAEFAALAAEKVGDPIIRDMLYDNYVPQHLRRSDYLLLSR